MARRILQWLKLISAALYLWNQPTAFIPLFSSKRWYYVTHSKKFNILIFNHRNVKVWTVKRGETVPDMTRALLSRKPQALSLRDSLHNNHISINGNKNNNKNNNKKEELPRRSWRQSCQVKCLDRKLSAAVEHKARFQGQNCFSISLFYLPDVHSALPFAYFYSTVIFLAGCHVWPQLGSVTREREREELKEQIHLTG